MNKILNIPFTANFLEELRDFIFNKHDNLSDVLVLLPNNYSCTQMTEICRAKLKSLSPAGELKIENFQLSNKYSEQKISLFNAIKQHSKKTITTPEALNLADNLISLCNELDREEVNLSDISDSEEYKLFNSISPYLKKIAKPHKNEDLVQNKRYVYLCGVTANCQYIKTLCKKVFNLSGGFIVLNGLDRILNDEEFNNIGEKHPQIFFKNLLQYLGLTRKDVTDIIPFDYSTLKNRLLTEISRDNIEQWVNSQSSTGEEGIGITLIECDNEEHECQTIIEHVKCQLNKTVGIICDNMSSKTRLIPHLKDVVKDLIGVPFGKTPIGNFFLLVGEFLCKEFSIAALFAILKSSKFEGGEIYKLEKQIRQSGQNITSLNQIKEYISSLELESIFSILQKQSFDIENEYSVIDIFNYHVECCEKLTNIHDEKFLQFVAKFKQDCVDMAHLDPQSYLELIRNIFNTDAVIHGTNSTSQVTILSSSEARLFNFDCVIICNLNFKNYNSYTTTILKSCGIKDYNTANSFYDFISLLNNKNILLTRSKTVKGEATSPSAFLSRLLIFAEDLLTKSTISIKDIIKSKQEQISEPKPRPDIALRPLTLSITDIASLNTNPYGFYAKKILMLKELSPLNIKPEAKDFGNFIHNTIAAFSQNYPNYSKYSRRRKIEEFIKIAEGIFYKYHSPSRIMWFARGINVANIIIDLEEDAIANYRRVFSEIDCEYTYNIEDLPIKIRGRIDRVEVDSSGQVTIMDFKTKNQTSWTNETSGKSPQLSLEALLLSKNPAILNNLLPESSQLDLFHNPKISDEFCAKRGTSTAAYINIREEHRNNFCTKDAERFRFGRGLFTKYTIEKLVYCHANGISSGKDVMNFCRNDINEIIANTEESLITLLAEFYLNSGHYSAYTDISTTDQYKHLSRADEWIAYV